jgi:archaemetzincin
MEDDLAAIEAGVATLLGVETRRLAPLPDPSYAFDPRRGQYRSVEVMRAFAVAAPAGDSKVLGVTERDLFIPMLTFIFGQAQMNGRLALVSLARLRQEFHGLPADRSVLLGRALREAAHELGHTAGLAHCPDQYCAMSLSTDIAQVDRKHAEYCASCKALIRTGVAQSGGHERKR